MLLRKVTTDLPVYPFSRIAIALYDESVELQDRKFLLGLLVLGAVFLAGTIFGAVWNEREMKEGQMQHRTHPAQPDESRS
jgi:hypothetical protein